MKLIVGLGNPGSEYENTRHNAGAWFVETLAERSGAVFRSEPKFHARYCQVTEDSHVYHLLLPTTFMNHSGLAVRAAANFYKIPPQAILVAHDELDLSSGVVKLKQGGGHGGHNGLRDIIQQIGDPQFVRLRVGIGHPGHKDHVLDYVLGRPSRSEKLQIEDAIDLAITQLPQLLEGHIQRAMNVLHSG